MQGQFQLQKQIPFGDDNKKSKCKGNCKSKSRFPSGMTSKRDNKCKDNFNRNSKTSREGLPGKAGARRACTIHNMCYRTFDIWRGLKLEMLFSH